MNSLLLLPVSIFLFSSSSYGFLLPSTIVSSQHRYNTIQHQQQQQISSSSALNVWWFGGTSDETPTNEESCELVPVRIERTSANSRKIAGEIIVEAPLADVWAILTDYNRLATHVPNLIQSKIMVPGNVGEPGDGSYQCRLYQQGAQKIVGFQFGADVTMQMTEKIMVDAPHSNADANVPSLLQQRQIGFRCVDSFFFSEFDGSWLVAELGDGTTKLTYTVDVRPKGPVPVAALEWRIREDVPTNLRAVKQASLKVGQAGVTQFRQSRQRLKQNVKRVLQRPTRQQEEGWSENETMAAYLK